MKNLFDIKDKVVVITGVPYFCLASQNDDLCTFFCQMKGKRWRSHVPDNRRDEP